MSLFALAVAVPGPTMPLLFSGINHKKVRLLVLRIFVIGNIVSIFAFNFIVTLTARIIPAFFSNSLFIGVYSSCLLPQSA